MAPSAIEIDPSILPKSQRDARPKVYLMDTFHPAAVARAQTLFQVVLPQTPEHINWRQAKYLLIRSSSLTSNDIASCPNLLAVGKQGVGTDKIDGAACASRGIKILNTPGVNARAVAELVLSLTTALARQIRPISLRMASGEVVRKEKCGGLILHKCKIGILGMGNIGRTVAKIFRGAFESSIIAYDPYMPSNTWSEIEHSRVNSVEAVLRESDIVTIHIPLTTDTKDLISYSSLKMMKKSAILINTARGGIVNETDLCRALDEKLIWGAGLDCHVQEPPTKERYEALWKHENVISLPHVGAATAQTQMETAVAAVERLYEYAETLSRQDDKDAVIETKVLPVKNQVRVSAVELAPLST